MVEEKFHRDHMVSKLESLQEEIDVLVIGGGASGLGTALDAATRGFKTLLVEKYDFAKGTSSRSTKLAHGGVRYLKQGDVSLVMEALHERGLMMQNAPHLVKNMTFVIPTYEWWGSPFYTMGLKVYEMLAGKLSIGPSNSLSKETTIEMIPTIEQEGLVGGVSYRDGQFDDARLALNLAQTIADSGGWVMNYTEVVGLLKEDGKVAGAKLKDAESGKTFEVRAKKVINATGVFSDAVMKMDNPDGKKQIEPSQGVHLVLDRSYLKGDNAVMVPKTEDGRVLYAIPFYDRVIVGTTDTPVEKVDAEPRALQEEIDFILSHATQYLNKPATKEDVKSVFAALRPLVKPEDNKETSSISRSHQVRVSESGLISLLGGKWTTYRRMGQDAVDMAIQTSELPNKECITRDITISGYKKNVDFSSPLHYYGSHLSEINYLMSKKPELDKKLHPELPWLEAQVVWAVDREMARTVEDFLSRRTRTLLLDARLAMEAAPRVAELMANAMGKDQNWIDQQVEDFNKLASGYIL
jgi:glycerol-3-phosphate dehydrogenase